MKKVAVCLVTEEFAGLNKSGGIGTCANSLYKYLTGLGYEVDLILTDINVTREGLPSLSQEIEVQLISEIILHDKEVQSELTCSAISFYIYRHIRNREYDMIHFNDWRGTGYHTSAARRQGLIKAAVVTHIHGSSEWVRSHNNYLPSFGDLELEAIERAQVQNSDFVISPSQYLVDWYTQQGLQLPETHVINWILPQWVFSESSVSRRLSTPALEPHVIEEYIFFGRHERRKGIENFIEALLALPVAYQFDVRLIGAYSDLDGEFSVSYILRKLKCYRGSISFVGNLTQSEAITSLHQNRKSLCVIPSIIENSPCVIGECFTAGLPFITSDVGGIRELINESSAEKCVIPATSDALSSRIVEIVEYGLPAIESTLLPRRIFERWKWFLDHVRDRSAFKDLQSVAERSPLVSICIVHHDRPQMLLRAVDCAVTQDYNNLEIIIVDDGSETVEAQACLDMLAAQIHPVPIKVVRSENRYLGAARNLAVQNAGGDFLIFHDDDNFLEPGAVKIYVSAIVTGGYDVLTSQYFTFDSRTLEDFEEARKIRFIHIGIGGIFSYFSNRFGDANAIVSRAMFCDIGGFSELQNVGFEDWEFFLKAHFRGYQIGNIPEPLFNYYLNPNGMLLNGSVRKDYDRIFSLISSENVKIEADLLKICFADSMAEFNLIRMQRMFSREPFGDLLSKASLGVESLSEKIRVIVDYALKIGRNRDAVDLILRNASNDVRRQFECEVSNRPQKKLSKYLEVSSASGYQEDLLITGWSNIPDSRSGVFSQLSVDNSKYGKLFICNYRRDDVVKHLNLSSADAEESGFEIIVRKLGGSRLVTRFIDRGSRFGLGPGIGVSSMRLEKVIDNFIGHVDTIQHVQVFDLPSGISANDSLLEVECLSQNASVCLIDHRGVLTRGFRLDDARLLFSIKGNFCGKYRVVVPVGSKLMLHFWSDI